VIFTWYGTNNPVKRKPEEDNNSSAETLEAEKVSLILT
jgi:hypothetical protein